MLYRRRKRKNKKKKDNFGGDMLVLTKFIIGIKKLKNKPMK